MLYFHILGVSVQLDWRSKSTAFLGALLGDAPFYFAQINFRRYHMIVKIDDAGRLVIPKEYRLSLI